MSFWNSKTVTARKEHKCTYCRFPIYPGEKYSRESGIYDDEFESYALCERCVEILNHVETIDDSLGDIHEDFITWGYLKCPKCGETGVDCRLKQRDAVEYDCQICGSSGEIDISLEAVKKIFEKEDAKCIK